jgi:hypothetical protein
LKLNERVVPRVSDAASRGTLAANEHVRRQISTLANLNCNTCGFGRHEHCIHAGGRARARDHGPDSLPSMRLGVALWFDCEKCR